MGRKLIAATATVAMVVGTADIWSALASAGSGGVENGPFAPRGPSRSPSSSTICTSSTTRPTGMPVCNWGWMPRAGSDHALRHQGECAHPRRFAGPPT